MISINFLALSLSGLFFIPVFSVLLYGVFTTYSGLTKFDTTYSFVFDWIMLIDFIVLIFLLPFGFFGSFIFGPLWLFVGIQFFFIE